MMRDTLLPKLIFGKLQVKARDRRIAEPVL